MNARPFFRPGVVAGALSTGPCRVMPLKRGPARQGNFHQLHLITVKDIDLASGPQLTMNTNLLMVGHLENPLTGVSTEVGSPHMHGFATKPLARSVPQGPHYPVRTFHMQLKAHLFLSSFPPLFLVPTFAFGRRAGAAARRGPWGLQATELHVHPVRVRLDKKCHPFKLFIPRRKSKQKKRVEELRCARGAASFTCVDLDVVRDTWCLTGSFLARDR